MAASVAKVIKLHNQIYLHLQFSFRDHDPSDQNNSHVEHFRILVFYTFLKTTSLALKLQQHFGSLTK